MTTYFVYGPFMIRKNSYQQYTKNQDIFNLEYIFCFIFRNYSEATSYRANLQSRPCPVCPQFVSFDTPKEAAIHVRLPEHKENVSMFLEKVKSKKN